MLASLSGENTPNILPLTRFALRLIQHTRFGDRLPEAPTARKLTQDELARSLGVSQSSVYIWLTHRAIPRSSALRQLADELAVSHLWLLSGSGEKDAKRISTDEGVETALDGSSPSDEPFRHLGTVSHEKAPGSPSAEEAGFHEMQASLRLVIGDLTDLQIIARLHEMLEDRNYSMSHRLTLVQALLSELQVRHQVPCR